MPGSGSCSAPLTAGPRQAVRPRAADQGRAGRRVVPGSPADKAGLKSGDVITAFNGENRSPDLSSFRLNVATSEVGKSYELTYYREGKKRTTTISPARRRQGRLRHRDARTATEGRAETKPEPAKTAINDFGLEVQPLTAELAKSLGLPADLKGLLVSSVKEGSPAAEPPASQAGNVITKVVRDQRSSR